MAEEKLKAKSLKLKESGGSELLKSAMKRSSLEKGTPDRKEQGNSLSKGKDALTPGTSKDPLRTSSFGKQLVMVGKEFAKSNEGKVSLKQEQRASEAKSPIKISGKTTTKAGASVKDEVKSPIKKEVKVSVKDEAKSPIKKEGKLSVKDGAKSPIKVLSKERKTLMKEKGNANGKEQQGKSVNGKERSKSVGKEVGKANGKSSAGVKARDEEVRDLDREKGKGKSALAKSSLAKTPTKSEHASKMSPKSITKAGASPSVVQSVKKKVTKTTTTVTATKTVTEQKKEKKVYDLPGQKHDPPEERDALRIFYTTLREQMPESDMAEIWLMEYGLLPLDEAQKAFERKQKRTQTFKLGGPSNKASTPSRVSNGSSGGKKSTPVSNGKGGLGNKTTPVSNGKDRIVSKAKKKRVSDSENDSDDDFLQNIMPKSKKKLKT